MSELSTGMITGTTRRAIIQDVAAKCLNYCKYPTTIQIEVVASKIVSTFPVLADTIGTGHASFFTLIAIISRYLAVYVMCVKCVVLC